MGLFRAWAGAGRSSVVGTEDHAPGQRCWTGRLGGFARLPMARWSGDTGATERSRGAAAIAIENRLQKAARVA